MRRAVLLTQCGLTSGVSVVLFAEGFWGGALTLVVVAVLALLMALTEPEER